MARPRCAACGSDLRKGQKLGFVDCYIVHHHCIHTPSNIWVVVQERAQAVADSAAQLRVLEAEIAELTASIIKHRRELEHADAVVRDQDVEHHATTARLRARSIAAEQRELEAVTLNQQLNGEVSRLRAQLRARATAAEQRELEAPASRAGRMFLASTIGSAVSRGVWGIAHYFAWKLDTVDPTVARFALLDLS